MARYSVDGVGIADTYYEQQQENVTRHLRKTFWLLPFGVVKEEGMNDNDQDSKQVKERCFLQVDVAAHC